MQSCRNLGKACNGILNDQGTQDNARIVHNFIHHNRKSGEALSLVWWEKSNALTGNYYRELPRFELKDQPENQPMGPNQRDVVSRVELTLDPRGRTSH